MYVFGICLFTLEMSFQLMSFVLKILEEHYIYPIITKFQIYYCFCFILNSNGEGKEYKDTF
jgi:hypothetical protein